MLSGRTKSILSQQSLRRAWVVLGMLCLPLLLPAQSLSYTVSWLGVPVVDVTITMTESDSSNHAGFHARTRSWFDRFYSVDNRYRIWVEPIGGYPIRYEKSILERGQADSLWAQYEQGRQRVVFANGLERPWREDTHALFSALLWIQKHNWTIGEEQDLLVEVEGVVWRVSSRCLDELNAGNSMGPIVEMQARFEQQLYGEPVLSTTDILTHMLPGEGHRLRFGLDLERDEVRWIAFGTGIFQVRAELNAIPEQL
ncbi:DUF3108 domain-containing protein [Candidatus Neomarinimicrobiota bacterium]